MKKRMHKATKERWKERKSLKQKNFRYRGKPCFIPPLEIEECEEEVINTFDLFFPSEETLAEKNTDLFIDEGINLLIDSNGRLGALSFNFHYKGKRIIFENN